MDVSQIHRSAVEIVQRLRQHGHEAFFVGGAVRDMIMGIEPTDFDIATSAAQSELHRLFKHVYPVGEQFGVNLVIEGGIPFEVARFRTESDYRDGRRPEQISSADAKSDVLRRDFTINALLYDPVEDRVIDHVDGIQDIERHIIRTIGDPDKRFAEDYLRMLRAVRFAARFGFTIDGPTMTAVRSHAARIRDISRERVGEEISKMLTGPHPANAIVLLDDSGILTEILPEVAAMKGIAQPVEYHPEGDVFEHTRKMLALLGGDATLTLALSVLLHDVGKPETMTCEDRIRFNRHDERGASIAEEICTRLRYSRAITDRVTMMVRNHMRFIQIRNMKESTRQRFMAMDGFRELLELFRLDCLASHGMLDTWEYAAEEYRKFLQTSPDGSLPKHLINGDDLIALGYVPGPEMGMILRNVLDAQLEGRITTPAEARAFVTVHWPLEHSRQMRAQKSNQQDPPECHDDTLNT